MSKAWEFFDHTADIGVRIQGQNVPDLFHNAALAMYDAMGTLALADHSAKRTIELKAFELDDLLHDWLTELLYEVEAHHHFYDKIEVLEAGPGGMSAQIAGGTIDFSRSHTQQEIKAVTYHHLRVESLPDGTWQATVIFDV